MSLTLNKTINRFSHIILYVQIAARFVTFPMHGGRLVTTFFWTHHYYLSVTSFHHSTHNQFKAWSLHL